jgi:hypothetical protein
MTSLIVVFDDRLCFGDVGENLEQFGWVGIGQPCGGGLMFDGVIGPDPVAAKV